MAHTYVKEAVDEWVIAGVAHCQAVAAQPDDVDVPVPAMQTVYKFFTSFLKKIPKTVRSLHNYS